MAEEEIIAATVPQVVAKEEETDEKRWQEIVKMLLDGVMFHTTCFEKFHLHNLGGFADMHRHHAIEEFENYLCACRHFIKHYGSAVDVSAVRSPNVNIDGTYENGLEIYEEWEKNVLKKLEAYHEKTTDGKDDIEDLIHNVKKELFCVRRMWDDIYENKTEELDSWLHKKFGE